MQAKPSARVVLWSTLIFLVVCCAVVRSPTVASAAPGAEDVLWPLAPVRPTAIVGPANVDLGALGGQALWVVDVPTPADGESLLCYLDAQVSVAQDVGQVPLQLSMSVNGKACYQAIIRPLNRDTAEVDELTLVRGQRYYVAPRNGVPIHALNFAQRSSGSGESTISVELEDSNGNPASARVNVSPDSGVYSGIASPSEMKLGITHVRAARFGRTLDVTLRPERVGTFRPRDSPVRVSLAPPGVSRETASSQATLRPDELGDVTLRLGSRPVGWMHLDAQVQGSFNDPFDAVSVFVPGIDPFRTLGAVTTFLAAGFLMFRIVRRSQQSDREPSAYRSALTVDLVLVSLLLSVSVWNVMSIAYPDVLVRREPTVSVDSGPALAPIAREEYPAGSPPWVAASIARSELMRQRLAGVAFGVEIQDVDVPGYVHVSLALDSGLPEGSIGRAEAWVALSSGRVQLVHPSRR